MGEEIQPGESVETPDGIGQFLRVRTRGLVEVKFTGGLRRVYLSNQVSAALSEKPVKVTKLTPSTNKLKELR